jgi:hypothetical protein
MIITVIEQILGLVREPVFSKMENVYCIEIDNER